MMKIIMQFQLINVHVGWPKKISSAVNHKLNTRGKGGHYFRLYVVITNNIIISLKLDLDQYTYCNSHSKKTQLIHLFN